MYGIEQCIVGTLEPGCKLSMPMDVKKDMTSRLRPQLWKCSSKTVSGGPIPCCAEPQPSFPVHQRGENADWRPSSSLTPSGGSSVERC